MPADPHSLVDYLRSEGLASDFASRRRLWGLFGPTTVYRGTGAQNTALLAHLRFSVQAPQLELTKQIFAENESITARVVADVTVSIESELKATSFTAEPREIVDLGPASSAVGSDLPWVRIVAGPLASHGTIVMTKAGGNVQVNLLMSSADNGGATIPVALSPSDLNLFQLFYEQVTANDGALLKQAFDAARKDFVAPEKWIGLAADVKLGVLLYIVEAAAPEVYLLGLGGSYAWEFGKTWLMKAVELTTHPIEDSDRTTLKNIINGVDFVKLAWDLRKIRKKKEICKGLEAAASLPGWTIDTFGPQDPEDPIKLGGKMFTDTVKKSVVAVCTLQKAKPK